MPRTLHSIQTNFTAGEISPRCYGRVDISKFGNACRNLENWVIQPQGGITRRMGTGYIAQTADMTQQGRLIEFQFSSVQAYVLEFGNYTCRFFKNGGQIQSGGSPVTLTTPWSSADLPLLNFTQSADVLYAVHPSHAPRQINRFSDIAWTLTTFNNLDGPYLDKNTDPTITISCSVTTGSGTLTASSGIFNSGHVGSIWRLEEAFAAKHPAWASGECFAAGRIVTANNNVYKMQTGGGTDMTAENRGLANWVNGDAYPNGYYCKWGQNCYVSSTSGTAGVNPPIHTSGTVSDGGVSWTYFGLITGRTQPSHTLGTESDDNCTWKYLHGGSGYVQITGYIDSQNLSCNVLSYVPDSCIGGTIFWREGAWSAYRGNPSSAAFFQQRFCFGGTPYQPQTVWMSETGNFPNFAPTEAGGQVVATTALTFTMASSQVNQIKWMTSSVDLLIGTIGGEWRVTSSNSGPVTPTTIVVTPQSNYGSAGIRPLRIGAAVVFVQKGAQKVRELVYTFTIDRYDGNELSLLAEHIPVNGGGIVDACYQKTPNSIWYGLLADGTLAACTYLRDQQVSGWTRIIAGGTYSGGQAVIESIACIPTQDGKEDQLYCIVKRTVNGSTVRYVEVFKQSYLPQSPTDSTGMWFVDAGIAYSGSPTSSISGVNHLIGQTVQVIADGAVYPDQVVSNTGTVTITGSCSNWLVGLEYDNTCTTLPPEGGGQYGTSQGKRKRTSFIDIRLFNTLGFRYGTGNSTKYSVSFRDSSNPMGSRPPLYSGDKRLLLDQSYVTDGQFTFGQSQPYPCTVLALMPEIVVYE